VNAYTLIHLYTYTLIHLYTYTLIHLYTHTNTHILIHAHIATKLITTLITYFTNYKGGGMSERIKRTAFSIQFRLGMGEIYQI